MNQAMQAQAPQPQQQTVVPFPVQPQQAQWAASQPTLYAVPQQASTQAFLGIPGPTSQPASPLPAQQFLAQPQQVQQFGVPQQFQGYPQTLQQPQVLQPSSTPNYSAAPVAPAVPQFVPSANQPAGVQELVQAYGSLEQAAYQLNAYALELEQALDQLAPRYQQMEQLLSDPSLLSQYYMGLEEYLQPGFTQQIEADRQLAEQARTQQRPAFPAMPQQQAQQQTLGNVHPSQMWKVIDQMPIDFWRNSGM